jgi:tripartite-type tricarboxylate transporter receptor subunit TctC
MNFHVPKNILSIAICGFAALLSGGALAQYPAKPITLLVPYAPGPTDTVARIMAQAMTKPIGTTFVVENRPSNGGILAPELLTKANPDGYTILIHHIGMATTPALYRQLRFKPLEDFEYIGLINEVPMTLIGRANLPPSNLKDLLAYIKANSAKMSLANAGIGAASHLCGMLFQSAIQVDLLTVPYKGTGPAMNDLLGGQVDFMCDQTTSTTAQIKAGKVKVYGVSTLKRVSSLPDVPTLDEQGLKGFNIAIWHGFYAPKGTPKAVIDKLSSALQEGLKDPLVKTRFNELGTDPVDPKRGTPEALRAHLKSEIDKWAPIIKAAGVYAD